MKKAPFEVYEDRIKSGKIKPDPIQEGAMHALQDLFDKTANFKISSSMNFIQRMAGFGQSKIAPKGIYMYGGVGRGKSMLMDLFYDCLPADIIKRRVHFHEFMIEVHDYLHNARQSHSKSSSVDQALPLLADDVAKSANILCFDEFHVTDIADAMILGRLFSILFEKGVIIVATSNWAPDDLYEAGLQRDRFLPFIDLLKKQVKTIHLDSPHDYRAQTIQIKGTYFYPLGRGVRTKLYDIFKTITGNAQVKQDIIEVKGRKIIAEKYADGVARFTFFQLCERPHGAEDYLAIASRYHTVFLEDVPKLGYDRRNEAKRFMAFIDAMYEARVRLIISAATKAENLYAGRDHAYEFERTISRLLEMQGKDYP